MSKKIILGLSLIFLTLSLSGCSLFSPIKNSKNTYVINSVNPNTIHAQPTSLTLLVNVPQTTQAYDTTQMAYIACPYELSYFSKNAWIDTPAQMLLPLMVQSLQNTCHYHAVVTPPFIGQSDLILSTQLVQLQQEFLECKSCSREHIIMRAQLINAATQRIIAACQFEVCERAPQNCPYGGVVAANCATAKLLAQLTQFCLQAS